MDVCVARLGLYDVLKPGKGFHFPDGSYVEYIGNVPEEKKNSIVDDLNTELVKVIAETEKEDRAFMKICEYEEAKGILGYVPPYIAQGDPFRVVKLVRDDKGCPCGGTHVPHIEDIGTVKVTKVKKSGKNTRISYKVE